MKEIYIVMMSGGLVPLPTKLLGAYETRAAAEEALKNVKAQLTGGTTISSAMYTVVAVQFGGEITVASLQ